MSLIKYRIHEVAKDFNVTSKVISQILTDYIATPKNHMQVLETPELDVIFEYMTQHNQAESLEEIFKTPAKPAPAPEKAKQEAKAEAKPAAASAEAGQKGEQKSAAKAPAAQSAAQQSAPQPQKKNDKPHTPRQVAEKRVVDTRGGAAVNIEKYNEKFEDMAGAKANNSNLRRGNKEKINSKSKQQRPNSAQVSSAKRRQEERDKMNRLQLEIAKKQPLKVEIPDEISVGARWRSRTKSAWAIWPCV